MEPIAHFPDRSKLFLALAIAYFVTSLAHFVHNAEFIGTYPNLPGWLTRTKVYAAWAAITSVGVLGFVLIRQKFIWLGLVAVAAYAAMGFDGLGHYAVAPMSSHTFGANLTIVAEVSAAALLLLVTLCLLKLQLFRNRRRA